jgi:hypothetical protein
MKVKTSASKYFLVIHKRPLQKQLVQINEIEGKLSRYYSVMKMTVCLTIRYRGTFIGETLKGKFVVAYKTVGLKTNG